MTQVSPKELLMWVVYDHPRDIPDHFVARMWWTGVEPNGRPTQTVMVCPEVEPIRKLLAERGLTRRGRQDGDDPVIMETWL